MTKDYEPLAYAVTDAKTVIAASYPQLFYPAGASATPGEVMSACLGAPLLVKN